MSSDVSVQQQALCHKYFSLADRQRSLVQTFALLYEHTSRVKAWQCWSAAFLADRYRQRFEAWNANQFGYQITLLIKQELLVQHRSQGPHCPSLLTDIAIRDAIRMGTFEPIVQAIQTAFPVKKRYGKTGPLNFRSEAEFLRELRIAIYRQDRSRIDVLMQDLRQCFWQSTLTFSQVLINTLTNPFDPQWITSLSPDFREEGLTVLLKRSIESFDVTEAAFELLEALYDNDQLGTDACLLYAEQLWLRGHLGEVAPVLDSLGDLRFGGRQEALRGAIAFLAGETQAAIAHYRQGLKAAGQSQAAQATWFKLPATLLYFFALLKDGNAVTYAEAEQHCVFLQQQPGGHWLKALTPLVRAVVKTQQGWLTQATSLQQQWTHQRLITSGLAAVLEIYCLYWLDMPAVDEWLPDELTRLYRMASQAAYGWVALEVVELMRQYEYEDLPDNLHAELAEALREEAGGQPLLAAIAQKEKWELSLDALTQVAQTLDAPTAVATPTFRMVWRLKFTSLERWELIPVEQKLSVKGGWTKGKQLSLKRLRWPSDRPDHLTEQDHKICDAIHMEYESSRSYYGSDTATYSFTNQALLALIGHPQVFWVGSENVRGEVVAGEPELLVKRLSGDRLRLELLPALVPGEDVLAFKETPTRLKVIAVDAQHRRIGELLGPKNQLEVPAQAEAQVLQAIASISTLITVQSDIGGGVAVEEVPADPALRAHLLPAGDGLKVSLLAHPFPEGGSYYAPGKGGETVIAEVAGKRLQTHRDLKDERQRAKAVKAACAVLTQYKAQKGEWLIEEPADCLELLLQLQSLDEDVKVEWPEGEKFRVSRQLGLSDFSLSIRRQQDWFAASGEVQISEDQVLDIQHLMTLLEGTPGRFVALSDGQFVALTDEFRKRLQTLKRLSESDGEGLRINQLAALALDDMVEDVEQLKVDRAWKAHLKKIKAAQTIEPQLPNDLQATLRDYQQDGYTWLSRLAQWGVGACLADDMGLGKTLQAIAVILSRSGDGPSLVIAPTSVGLNWVSEIERFAPTLQVQVFGSGDRQKMLDQLAAKEVLVCSYGLLQQAEVAAMLGKMKWQTVVLDEAQAIKNAATKRSQAAMGLQGQFKIITTGTPIENHLGELWNLFRFINPGLLGSLDSFNQRFANPIERDQDEAAREALRRLIRPFILRRTKDQVLKELPSRTEITLQVELSSEEMAFYEALRREAIEKLSESDAPAGQKHLQVLAEIMKLRRACCNPSLVKPELSLPSAKLEQFGEVLGELLENGHKALVFSQFVDHLAILRNYLDAQKIAYQYLDGSTPAKQRQARVDAFQQGQGEVFLISLKAGGTGLNLTAADYVIHMDPWWNPAVEDQASDRAHRIGQQRPVTIYRLVAKGTIEDKIVGLHQVKRDLADSLLSGSDVSGKISTDELLSLLQDG